MARTWSGFLPQNESIKRQWGLFEATPGELADTLQTVLREIEQERSEAGGENENLIYFRSHKPE